jgi:ABC-type antimicrobial peptide transport system permease subunit
MRQMVSDSIARPRLEAQVLSIFGLLALGLASLGLYGLVAFSVTQRSREIGIRVALGASKPTILRMVLGDGLKLATVGVSVGLIGFIGLTHFLRSLLFQVKPADPPTLISVTSALLVVSLLASLVPAQRATKANPATILHDE